MSSLSQIKKPLYKYVQSIEAVENLIQGKIKFASFYELNDATEAATVDDEIAIEHALSELQLNGLSEPQFQKLKITNKFLSEAKLVKLLDLKTPEAAHAYFRQRTRQDMGNLLKKVSMNLKGTMASEETHSLHYFCLSKKNQSLPMWAHYANLGFGFVVVFQNLEEIFDSIEPWEFNGLHLVKYYESRPAITHDPMSIENLFLTKTIDWQYEEEVRVIKIARDLENLDIGEKQMMPMKSLTIDKKYVTGVIIGFQNDAQNSHLIYKKINEIRSDLNIGRSYVQPDGLISIKQMGLKS